MQRRAAERGTGLQAGIGHGRDGGGTAPDIVHDVLRSSGQPLDAATRTFFEPRFGHDFGRVRVHTGPAAAESAHAVNAIAYTVGRHVVFGAGQYQPRAARGRQLLGHELAHVVQQQGAAESGSLRVGSAHDRSEAEAERAAAGALAGAAPVSVQSAAGKVQRQAAGSPSSDPANAASPAAGQTPAHSTPKPETCAPPAMMGCPAATSSPGGVTNTLVFPQDSALLNAAQKAELDGVAASWNTHGATGTVRLDGYASAEGACEYNWALSCRRTRAVAAELESPVSGAKGIPAANLSLFAHGESDEAGAALEPNRRVTVSLPVGPPAPGKPTPSPTPPPPRTAPTQPAPHQPAPTPPQPSSPPASPAPAAACKLPRSLGVGRTGCGTGTDFTHFDFPSISFLSAAKLGAWAAANPANLSHVPDRTLVPNWACEQEMDGVLRGFAGSSGHAAFARFQAGTGGTETLGPASDLGKNALGCGSFAKTLAAVKSNIESQLAAQAPSGKLDPCALSVVPPATHFGVSDGMKLKAVIGGTHGESLNANAFTGDAKTRAYSIDLEFFICDNFGVDEADLYAPGLFPFWVLQHERSATLYAPFINLLDLPVTVSGTF